MLSQIFLVCKVRMRWFLPTSVHTHSKLRLSHCLKALLTFLMPSKLLWEVPENLPGWVKSEFDEISLCTDGYYNAKLWGLRYYIKY